MTLKLGPVHAAIGRAPQSASRSATGAAVGMNFDLPHTRKEDLWVVRIHRHVGAAGVFVNEEHLRPTLATIGGAENAAIRLRAISVAERTGKNKVRIRRVDDHIANAAGFLKAHARPGFARIR